MDVRILELLDVLIEGTNFEDENEARKMLRRQSKKYAALLCNMNLGLKALRGSLVNEAVELSNLKSR